MIKYEKLSVIVHYTATSQLNTRNKPYKFFSVTQGRDNIQSLSVIVNVMDEINGIDYCTSLFVLSVIVHYTKLNGIDYWTSLFVFVIVNVTATSDFVHASLLNLILLYLVLLPVSVCMEDMNYG